MKFNTANFVGRGNGDAAYGADLLMAGLAHASHGGCMAKRYAIAIAAFGGLSPPGRRRHACLELARWTLALPGMP